MGWSTTGSTIGSVGESPKPTPTRKVVEDMDSVTYRRIREAVPSFEDFTVRLLWENGTETIARFGDLVGHGVFEPMRDPHFFNQVTTFRNGRVLAWPNEIDFGADDLWFEAHPEDIPETMVRFYQALPAKLAPSGP